MTPATWSRKASSQPSSTLPLKILAPFRFGSLARESDTRPKASKSWIYLLVVHQDITLLTFAFKEVDQERDGTVTSRHADAQAGRSVILEQGGQGFINEHHLVAYVKSCNKKLTCSCLIECPLTECPEGWKTRERRRALCLVPVV